MQGRWWAASTGRTGSRSGARCTGSTWTSWSRAAWRTPASAPTSELEAMKRDAEAKGLPPIYRGRWARASAEEVADMMAQVRSGGAPTNAVITAHSPGPRKGEPAAAGLHICSTCLLSVCLSWCTAKRG